MTAYNELLNYLDEGETVEGLVFGAWGWGGYSFDGSGFELGFGEPDPPPVPMSQRGKVLSLELAKPYMAGWNFAGGYGSPEAYATYIWTNRRVIWVTQYDGATCLTDAPRHPTACQPEMPGG